MTITLLQSVFSTPYSHVQHSTDYETPENTKRKGSNSEKQRFVFPAGHIPGPVLVRGRTGLLAGFRRNRLSAGL